MRAQRDGFVRALRDQGVEVVPLEGEIGNRFKAWYTRDSSSAIRIDGAILMVDVDLTLVNAQQLTFSFLEKVED